MSTKKYAYEDTRLAKLLTDRLLVITNQKSQRDVANELGYKSPNVISMFKRGEIRVPLDKAHDLARVIGVDPKFLFRLALEQQFDEENIEDLFGNQVSDNEMVLVKMWREVTEDTDLYPPASVKATLAGALGASF